MVPVWDPLVRVFHWTLVLAFFTAYLTEDDFQDLHVLAGYTVLGLLAFRIPWGFIGPRHARFSDFVFAPSTIIGYVKSVLLLRPRRYLGHNPAGGAMIVLLLVCLAGLTYSGLAAYAAEEGKGPLAGGAGAPALVAEARANGDDDDDRGRRGRGRGEDGDSVWSDIHEALANFTLFLVFIHVCGVIVESALHRENLVRAMFTGRKRPLDAHQDR